ncbi:aminoglycoside adenylyltransferase domain-containing protein [Streptomyces scopuliridis]|uniref:aminoglycoside adenylyltransferase domain-containing protein n=1 Tax=Streptomyces scopuliridis TaxID=452529 RepID=UPI0036BC47A6
MLGADVIGSCLHGSAVLGGLRPHSDIDVFAVVRRPTTVRQRRVLVDGLLELSGERARHGPARPVESTVATGSVAAKDAAADRALARLPAEHRPPPARARAICLGDEEERRDDLLPYVGAYADHVVAAIGRGTTGPDVTPRGYC